MASLTEELEKLRAQLDTAKARRSELQGVSRSSGSENATELEADTQDLQAKLADTQARIKSHAASAAESTTWAEDCREKTAAMERALEAECVGARDIVARQSDTAGLAPEVPQTMVSVNSARFADFGSLAKRLATAREEEKTVLARIDELQDKAERALPVIEQEAERHVAELTSSWQKEKDELRGVYDKLMQINREQQFHLQRGTHVKSVAPVVRDATTAGSAHETALSARHAQLTAKLLEAKGRLSDLENENVFSKRSADSARQDGRKSIKEFEEMKREVGDRLRYVTDERVRAEEEKDRFRDLRSEMQQALQAIRESPSATIRRR